MFPHLDALLGPLYFWLFAAIACLCGIGLLAVRHPLQGTLCLIGVMLSLAGIYALLDSPFVAVLQVLVYAGAIMMLLVFVIMVLNQAKDDSVPRFDALSVAGLVLPLGLAAVVVRTLHAAHPAGDATAARAGIRPLANTLFDLSSTAQAWWLLFELGGLLLLAAVVGAVVLAKRRLDRTGDEAFDRGPAPRDDDAGGPESHHQLAETAEAR